MRARLLIPLLVAVTLAGAPAASEAGQTSGPRRAAAARIAKKTWRGARRLSRRARAVARDAVSGGLGKVAVAAGALGGLNLAGGHPRQGLLALAAAGMLGAVNAANHAITRRAYRRAQAFRAAEEERWAREDHFFRFEPPPSEHRAPPRAAPRDPAVAAAYRYFQLAPGTSPAAAKEQAKRTYRKLAREFHPDVAVPRGTPKQVAEEKFAELARHYEVISGM